MTPQELFSTIPVEKLSLLSKDELVVLIKAEQDIREKLQKENDRLRARFDDLRQKQLIVDEQYVTIKAKLFGKSSERSPQPKQGHKERKKAQRRLQLPSQRYPDAPLIEQQVELEKAPDCSCCGAGMKDSGMTEDSEFLTVVPAQFLVIRQKRHKYRCPKCHGDVKTAPAPPRIQPGSAYSDDMIIDVALSKYCDLIPIVRYAAIAGRLGMEDIPPPSLIQLTHYLADFLALIYAKLREEALSSRVLHADETPHRMLEGGGDKSSWYLWGFSTPHGSTYFEIRDTRSGDVASELLINSACEYLVSDVFSGYAKAVRKTNEARKELDRPGISNIYCNAHARRKFKEAEDFLPEQSQAFIKLYARIYRLNKVSKTVAEPEKILRLRKMMVPRFEKMKKQALEQIAALPSKSALAKAMTYYLKNYEQLTAFTQNVDLPIDNNLEERQLRNPVVGRKTWYGNHSQRGARTSAILFSLVESCKAIGLNPREYFKAVVQTIHAGRPPLTPLQFKNQPA